LILRVGDGAAGWHVWATTLVDRMVMMWRGTIVARLHVRPLTEWIACLEAAGFDVASHPMSEGTPFANMLLTCTRR
jgi:hypothetical protein